LFYGNDDEKELDSNDDNVIGNKVLGERQCIMMEVEGLMGHYNSLIGYMCMTL
jgi:hypothetical protein